MVFLQARHLQHVCIPPSNFICTRVETRTLFDYLNSHSNSIDHQIPISRYHTNLHRFLNYRNRSQLQPILKQPINLPNSPNHLIHAFTLWTVSTQMPKKP
ncbi:hypothetical protein KC19_11G126600 [Ceratodon purpureus]|uniref:Uncharacterized protein n=1 Tax=Ceratodon purpureus TaxID=3225 RepID=A0A8T0GGW4_CERPU|nr:hypothetical protein KC19_11G126600 [Ceratodon purpureus]